MKGFRLLAACLAVSAPALSAASVTVLYSEPLERLTVAGEAASGPGKPGAEAPATMRFDAFGRTFELALEPNRRLLSDAARAALRSGARVYRGGVAGKPGSWSRLVIGADGLPRGLIRDGAELYALEVDAAGSGVIYRLRDLHVPPGSAGCGSEASDAAALYGGLVNELDKGLSGSGAKGGAAVSRISIGAIGDYELFQAQGPGSEVAILTRLNNVDGIFSEQLGVQIHVEDVHIFTGPADPFGDTLAARALLDELAAYRAESWQQRSLALTHLYTGRNLEGSTVGIAFNGTLCEAKWGVGLTQLGGNVTFDSLVAAHEIGHNFGAPHDGETGSACAAETRPFLMAPSINGNDEFSSCSLTQMQPRIQTAYCVAPVPAVDAAIALPDGLPAVALGSSVTARFDVTNGGTADASGVVVDVTLPVNASFAGASASQGACADGAGRVRCEIGDVPAGSNRTVTVTMIGAEVGRADLVAGIELASDNDPANNEVIAELRVAPAAEGGSEAPVNPVSAAPPEPAGGGGAAGLPLVFLLAAAALRRRLATRLVLAHHGWRSRASWPTRCSRIAATPAAGWRKSSRTIRLPTP